jgi:AdoMet-dependent rRNA methyltransferase SPB1
MCWIKNTSLNHVLKWRTRIRKALSSCSQVTPKADVPAMDAKVKDGDQLFDKKEEMTSIIDRKARRHKR